MTPPPTFHAEGNRPRLPLLRTPDGDHFDPALVAEVLTAIRRYPALDAEQNLAPVAALDVIEQRLAPAFEKLHAALEDLYEWSLDACHQGAGKPFASDSTWHGFLSTWEDADDLLPRVAAVLGAPDPRPKSADLGVSTAEAAVGFKQLSAALLEHDVSPEPAAEPAWCEACAEAHIDEQHGGEAEHPNVVSVAAFAYHLLRRCEAYYEPGTPYATRCSLAASHDGDHVAGTRRWHH